MAQFPAQVATFRQIENLPGMEYDETDKRTLFAEDIAALRDEIVALQNYALSLKSDLTTQQNKQEYKVGDIFLSFNSTDPATVKGYGTWALRGQGRTLVGVDTGDTDFNTVKKTGGAKTHTLTLSQLPNVTGSLSMHGAENATTIYYANGVFYNAGSSPRYGNVGVGYTGAASIGTVGFSLGGGGGAHNNLQPYLTCYIWERTA